MDSPASLVVEAVPPVAVLCDAIDSLGVHNGVARLRLSRLTAEGASVAAVELLAPTSAVAEIVRALQLIKY